MTIFLRLLCCSVHFLSTYIGSSYFTNRNYIPSWHSSAPPFFYIFLFLSSSCGLVCTVILPLVPNTFIFVSSTNITDFQNSSSLFWCSHANCRQKRLLFRLMKGLFLVVLLCKLCFLTTCRIVSEFQVIVFLSHLLILACFS